MRRISLIASFTPRRSASQSGELSNRRCYKRKAGEPRAEAQVPISSIKRVKKKNVSHGWNFCCIAADWNERELF
jgi:hypothetical protein